MRASESAADGGVDSAVRGKCGDRRQATVVSRVTGTLPRVALE